MKLSTSFIFTALSISAAYAYPQKDARAASLEEPLVDSALLQESTSKDALLEHARRLFEFSQLSNGTRAFGTEGHNATVKYIKEALDATGYYDTELQSFVSSSSRGMTVFTANDENIESEYLVDAPAGDVNALLAPIANFGCELTDYPGTEVEGKIVLISRGNCEFGLKVALAGTAKAAGVIIYNNVPGPLNGGLGAPRPDVGPYVPAAAISQDLGQALITRISSGATVTGNLHVEVEVTSRYSSNVIATTKSGDKTNIVMAGAHTDSVPEGPGINDNGSGTITILDIALRLARYSVQNAVRFGFWTAEEIGLVGSDHYVAQLPAEEAQKIALYLNFDMCF
ncbi:hypothetical protein NMY22_g15111 [Coprinellus aureogranulatus]|nr:hypothetical protein NMY22_g15111 [Coprinellus aureogranulatus]